MNQGIVHERPPALVQLDRQAAKTASFAPIFSELRDKIRQSSPEHIARLSGADWDSHASALHLKFLGVPHRVTWPDLVAYRGDADVPCSNHILGIFLYFLSLADGVGPAGQWISFRELPDGWLYHQAFQGYTGKVLAPAVNNDVSALAQAAANLDAVPLDLGDAGFEFIVLPNVKLAIVYWGGDNEFDAEAQVLFDAAAHHYLTTDGLAIVGSHLVQQLLGQL